MDFWFLIRGKSIKIVNLFLKKAATKKGSVRKNLNRFKIFVMSLVNAIRHMTQWCCYWSGGARAELLNTKCKVRPFGNFQNNSEKNSTKYNIFLQNFEEKSFPNMS